eukprot:CAMPEP_0182841444 /NCGR_PEP_ID=MMETSP0006_2-20121128/25036_1 /TAXON_ID=97485 /ORGANISM="Prymnesium parvum, Strain Texoma1" /LENGTH=110 /DNA_ID=CAMNT_0024970927 /DNA_START=325 /DNA_END=658 /DNA_ORIENTATION=+
MKNACARSRMFTRKFIQNKLVSSACSPTPGLKAYLCPTDLFAEGSDTYKTPSRHCAVRSPSSGDSDGAPKKGTAGLSTARLRWTTEALPPGGAPSQREAHPAATTEGSHR